MTYKNILKYQPWLRFVNINNISTRLMRYTKGDVFIAYNTLTQSYELHSISAFKLTGYSQNCVVEKDLLNDWLYKDFRASELKKFMLDIQSDRQLKEHYYQDFESKRPERLREQLKLLERVIGTKI
jgi:hypothetical protein